MQVVDNLIQKIRSIPENIREPKIPDKEIEQIANNLRLVHEYECARRMYIN
jgi:hypothetical protein